MEQLKERPKHALNLTKTGVSRMIKSINTNYGDKVCALVEINQRRANIAVRLRDDYICNLYIYNDGEIIFESASTSLIGHPDYIMNFSDLRYAELESLVLLLLLPWAKNGKPLQLKVLEVDSGCSFSINKLARKDGKTAKVYNKALIAALKNGLVELVNAKVSADFKILPLDSKKPFKKSLLNKDMSCRWE